MPDDPGYVYPNHSELYRQIKRHYRRRGVTSERKLEELTFRWVRQKGKRPPREISNQ